jgi:hypothetical protein
MPYKNGQTPLPSSPADSIKLDIAAMEKEIARLSNLRDNADELGRAALQKEIDQWTARGNDKKKRLEAQ